jgi:hypothetical protein
MKTHREEALIGSSSALKKQELDELRFNTTPTRPVEIK